MGRLIEAKKAYDNPRSILRRGSANAVTEQDDKKVEDRIDKLEKALLNAIEKYNPHTPSENEKPLVRRKGNFSLIMVNLVKGNAKPRQI